MKKRDKWPWGSIWCKQANDIYTIQCRNRQMNQGCIMPPSENHHQAIWTGKLLTFTSSALLLALADVLQHLLHHMTVGKYTCRLDSSKIPDPRNHCPALFTQLAPVCMHYQYKQLLRVLMFWWAVDRCLHTHKYTHLQRTQQSTNKARILGAGDCQVAKGQYMLTSSKQVGF